jgi:acetoin utilization deacetylase AcuC-like enzyme
MRVYFSPDYVGGGHAFETTRKAGWVADSLSREPVPGVVLEEPPPLAREALETVHDPDYVRAVETGRPKRLAESQWFPWDAGLWPMVRASNGGMVAAALAALEDGVAGSLSSGLHHARRERGSGYCTFNGLVLAARAALAAGSGPVLVLDLDTHCGGGTVSMIADQPEIRHVDVSFSRFDRYEPGEGRRLAVLTGVREYLPTVASLLDEESEAAGGFGLCLYNAGMDVCQDSADGFRGMTAARVAEREAFVFAWCRERKIPIAFALAGGYLSPRLDRDGLAGLHRLTVRAAAGDP